MKTATIKNKIKARDTIQLNTINKNIMGNNRKHPEDIKMDAKISSKKIGRI